MITKEAFLVLTMGIIATASAVLYAAFVGLLAGTSIFSWVAGALVGTGSIMAAIDAS